MLKFVKENDYGRKLPLGDYDVYFNDKLIAEVRTHFTLEKTHVYYKDENDQTVINSKYLTVKEATEKAKRIIQKKLYKEAMEILEGLREPTSIL